MSDTEETTSTPSQSKVIPPPPVPPPPKRVRGAEDKTLIDEPPIKQACMDTSVTREDANAAHQVATASRQGISNVILQEEFEIIDDLGSDGEEAGNGIDDKDDLLDDDDSFMDSDEDDDFLLNSEEIDKMLDEGIDQTEGGEGDQGELTAEERALIPPTEKEKIVLVERGHDPFDILPEGWVVVTHNSGMPVYLHKKSRVCTLSRPYFLGPGSARKHDVPISAIPCLQYRRAIEKESEQKLITQNGDVTAATCPVKIEAEDMDTAAITDPKALCEGDADVKNEDGEAVLKNALPSVRVETAEQYKKVNSLEAEQVREYCQKVFEFQAIKVRRFKTWKDRRKHNNLIKKANLWKKSNRPSLPANTKLITCPIPTSEEGKGKGKKEFVLNPAGKSDVCILHEYVQHALRVQPRFIFEELDNAQTPFSATVMINDTKYATGFATSKKAAKLEAASKTLAILIPDINKAREEEKQAAGGAKSTENKDLLFFDQIKIEDPRVTELSVKAGQPYPFQILYECLKRNYGIGDTEIHMEMKTLKHQKSEFLMRVGKHEAKVVCKNKREGKQQAAQAILQLMHPHIHTWGSLLRLYSKDNTPKEEDEEEEEEGLTVLATAGLKQDPVSGELALHQEATLQVIPAAEDGSREYYGMMVRDMEAQTGEELSNWEVEAREVDEKMWKEKEKMLQESMITGKFYLYKVHRAVQTEWEGQLTFHKAVQYPEVLYTKEDVEHWGTRPESQPAAITSASDGLETTEGGDKQNAGDAGMVQEEVGAAENKKVDEGESKKEVIEMVQTPMISALASRVAAQQEAINRSPSRAQLAAFASSQAAAAAYQRSVMPPTSMLQYHPRAPAMQAAGSPYYAAAAAAAARPQSQLQYVYPQMAAQQQLQQLQQLQQYQPLSAHTLPAAAAQPGAQYVQLMPQSMYQQAPLMMPLTRPQAGIYPMGAYQPR